MSIQREYAKLLRGAGFGDGVYNPVAFMKVGDVGYFADTTYHRVFNIFDAGSEVKIRVLCFKLTVARRGRSIFLRLPLTPTKSKLPLMRMLKPLNQNLSLSNSWKETCRDNVRMPTWESA
jgi:hypothetical protein